MHEKDIKRLVVKQLKKDFPKWGRIPKKEKKLLAKSALEELVRGYSLDKEIDVPMSELTGVPAISEDIMTLSDMEKLIEDVNGKILRLSPPSRRRCLKDPELSAIDELLDDAVINRLIAPPGYTPSMREVHPSHMLRAELLKGLKYGEFSYRKFCGTQINDLERKENRTFVNLPLHKKRKIDHSRLSQFRAGLTFSQLVNLMVYMIHLFMKSGRIDGQSVVFGVDSTELAAPCSPAPLASIEVAGKKVRIYSDLDADCGKRRRKRDKSEYFVGYRLHSLAAINPENGHSFPLLSLLAPGNHHDNLFMPQLIALGKAIGLDLKVVTADEAYGDAVQNEEIRKEYGVTVVTPAKGKVKIPEYVDEKTKSVFKNEWCETPMSYSGRTEMGGHEFGCGADPHECLHMPTCSGQREIPVDSGLFGQIPDQLEGVQAVRDLRKNMERPYNLLKHREGLESTKVKSQHSLTAVATFAMMATLLLEIVGTRKVKKKDDRQQKLDLAA
jgi:hypothetical protein